MSVLSDADILGGMTVGQIKISPFDRAALQPASVDVVLGDRFAVFETAKLTHIDPREPMPMKHYRTAVEEPFVLHPGEFALGHTVERITVGDTVAARIEGKSSLARLGLIIHQAGWIDPGFTEGQITLELANISGLPIKLWPGMKIAQVAFFDLTSRAIEPYGERNHYQGQLGATPSRAYLQFAA